MDSEDRALARAQKHTGTRNFNAVKMFHLSLASDPKVQS